MSGDDERLVVLSGDFIAPLQELAGLYQKYGSIPRAIAAIISLYIVNSVVSLGAFVVNSVLQAFDIFVGALGVVQATLVYALTSIGTPLIEAYEAVQMVIADVVASAGPFGYPLVIISAAVVLYVTYEVALRVSVALLGEIPIGSSIVDVLGLR